MNTRLVSVASALVMLAGVAVSSTAHAGVRGHFARPNAEGGFTGGRFAAHSRAQWWRLRSGPDDPE